MGLCQVPDLLVADELARGELEEVLPALRPAPMPISLVHPSGRLVPARVAAALDALDALRLRAAGGRVPPPPGAPPTALPA